MYDYMWERALGYDSWDRSAMGGVCLTTKFCDPGGHEDLAGPSQISWMEAQMQDS